LEVVHSEARPFEVDAVAGGLKRGWSLAFLPDDRVLIAERTGGLRVVRDGQLPAAPVKGNVPNELRDVVPPPRFDENGWIYFFCYMNPDSVCAIAHAPRLAAEGKRDGIGGARAPSSGSA
jgi:glucose/arabinose dehydrogenase